MSKQRPNKLSELKQGWVYLDAGGTVMWLTTEADRNNWDAIPNHQGAPLWHLNVSGGTWQIDDLPEFYPMTRLVRSQP